MNKLRVLTMLALLIGGIVCLNVYFDGYFFTDNVIYLDGFVIGVSSFLALLVIEIADIKAKKNGKYINPVKIYTQVVAAIIAVIIAICMFLVIKDGENTASFYLFVTFLIIIPPLVVELIINGIIGLARKLH